MMVRMKSLLGFTAVACLAAGTLVFGAPPAKGDQKTVMRWVLDSDGSIYWPIAEAMPAEGQNKINAEGGQ